MEPENGNGQNELQHGPYKGDLVLSGERTSPETPEITHFLYKVKGLNETAMGERKN